MTSTAPHIAILTHEHDALLEEPRLVRLMIPRWEAMGSRVSIVTGTDTVPPADVAILHVDLSVVPEPYRRLAATFRRTVNGRVHDIRKRAFSNLIVDRTWSGRGPVIVKTDWNVGGLRELRLGILESRVGGWIRRLPWHGLARLEAARPWGSRRALPGDAYSIYPSVDDVPKAVWDNPNLVVERFVAEREGRRYACRHWLFLGSREVTRRTVSPHPVVKLRGPMERTDDTVPAELRRIRRELGFDYGKFDYGIVDGEVVLYDVNRTPGASADPRRHDETVAALAGGIRDFLPGRSTGSHLDEPRTTPDPPRNPAGEASPS